MSHQHGIAVPLFALRSQNSCGIGEFLDLLPLIDWCSQVGLQILQLTPLNDTGPNESPFSPISSCALDPIYISLHALPEPPSPLEPCASFNALPRLNRFAVREGKLEWLQSYFAAHFEQIAKTGTYQEFVKKQGWLLEYAAFQNRISPMGSDFPLFLQYLAFSQMKSVKARAESKKVRLQGDLPFLLPALSADLEAFPSLFHKELVAGAPPDPFNPEGQVWGFPLYDIEAMRRDQFRWWERRLKVFEECYHLYRIDHVAGLFRTWAFPKEGEKKEGQFVPANPALWAEQGREILSKLLSCSKLLPIAEDLGDHVREVTEETLKELGIPGTRVLRWEHNERGEYLLYHLYDACSMSTVSTFDTDPLPLWWQSSPEEAKNFAAFKKWAYEPTLTREQQGEILWDSHHTASGYHINPLQEFLLLFEELSWPHLETERINRPGTILPTNWTYRFRPSVEEIVEHLALSEKMRQLMGYQQGPWARGE